jgi:catechol 2,3-dioxygenase-like lactoylglutathione lyase family enzyme
MVTHRLTNITIGVPDVAVCAQFYRDFGLVETAPNTFATSDGGDQLHLVHGSRRMLTHVGIGVDDGNDLDRLEASVGALDFPTEREGDGFVVVDPATEVNVRVEIAERLPEQRNGGPGQRRNERAPAVDRTDPVRPKKLGHIVLGSPDVERSRQLFLDGLGFKVSDEVPGLVAFMRCSTDHHNVAIQAAPMPFLHHTSWQVDDVDEVGRGGNAMIETDPERHLWGLGRHYLGSNWFWYLRDPAGNFAEYHADLDLITDDEAWESTTVADHRALYAWAPPVPDDFLAPPDLVAATGEA